MNANNNTKFSKLLDIEIVTHISQSYKWLNWYIWKYIASTFTVNHNYILLKSIHMLPSQIFWKSKETIIFAVKCHCMSFICIIRANIYIYMATCRNYLSMLSVNFIKSGSAKDILYAKGDRHPASLLAFSRRRRNYMTSLTLWWRHVFYSPCILYLNSESA